MSKKAQGYYSIRIRPTTGKFAKLDEAQKEKLFNQRKKEMARIAGKYSKLFGHTISVNLAVNLLIEAVATKQGVADELFSSYQSKGYLA